MTREEAIKEIIRAYDVLDFSCHMDNRRKESFNMAKVALEQESILDKIYADIQRLRGCSCYCSDGIIDDVEDILDKYKVSEVEE